MQEEKAAESPVVCYCFGKTASEIRDEVLRLGLATAEQVAQHLRAGNGCTLCRPEIEQILAGIRQTGKRNRLRG